MSQNTAKEIAAILLDLGCVELSVSKPFQYASGLKGPIYCDNRKILSHPKERKKVISAFTERLNAKGWGYDHIAGLATAGIAHAALMAQDLEASMIYVRSKPKSHGKRQQLEGDFRQGESLVLVEDLVNQGASLNEALEGVKDAGLSTTGCLSIVHYQMPAATQVIDRCKLDFEYLTDFGHLCDVALEKGLIKPGEIELLRSW